MWIFTQFGFFSVTQTPDRSDLIQIRARSRKHLENLKTNFAILERSPIITTPDADYRFRVVCKRWRWEKLSDELAKTVTYPNFKGKVQAAGWCREMLHQLHEIWGIMNDFQRRQAPQPVDPDQAILFPDARDRDGLFDDADEPGVAPATKRTKRTGAQKP